MFARQIPVATRPLFFAFALQLNPTHDLMKLDHCLLIEEVYIQMEESCFEPLVLDGQDYSSPNQDSFLNLC
jgi:hypothetical protein